MMSGERVAFTHKDDHPPGAGTPVWPVRAVMKITIWAFGYGRVKATYVPPDGASFFPPPQAMTMYCFPFTM